MDVTGYDIKSNENVASATPITKQETPKFKIPDNIIISLVNQKYGIIYKLVDQKHKLKEQQNNLTNAMPKWAIDGMIEGNFENNPAPKIPFILTEINLRYKF